MNNVGCKPTPATADETQPAAGPSIDAAKTPASNLARAIYRHPLLVRLCHWINAVSVVLLFMSGLQIFNSYPRLHWGNVGNEYTPAIFEITGKASLTDRESWMQVGSYRIDTTGVLGVPRYHPFTGVANWAFPGWMTLPSTLNDLGHGRGWHFLMIWIFTANLLLYLAYGLFSRRFWRELLPSRAQLRPAAILDDLWQHLRFKHDSVEAARHYNLLQKLAYIGVIFFCLPIQVLTGMAMSNTAVAILPWLIDLFDGRQTARTLHFIVAWLLVLFLLIHVFQVFVAGVVNELRSMITGYVVIPGGEKK